MLLEVLERAPSVQLLVTSRARLGLRDERIVALRGLPTELGVRLFVERSQRIMPEFEALAADQAAIEQIVTQVDGLPLGIELAAIWVEHFTPNEIAASIAESHAFLEDGKDGRQSSVQAAWVQTIAERNVDPNIRNAYLENIPAHQQLKLLTIS